MVLGACIFKFQCNGKSLRSNNDFKRSSSFGRKKKAYLYSFCRFSRISRKTQEGVKKKKK